MTSGLRFNACLKLSASMSPTSSPSKATISSPPWKPICWAQVSGTTLCTTTGAGGRAKKDLEKGPNAYLARFSGEMHEKRLGLLRFMVISKENMDVYI